MLGRRIDMECIVESEHAHACLLISVFRDIGRVHAAVVITMGVKTFRGASTCAHFSWPVGTKNL